MLWQDAAAQNVMLLTVREHSILTNKNMKPGVQTQLVYCLLVCVLAYDLYLTAEQADRLQYIFPWQAYEPRFHFAKERTLSYRHNYTNITRLLLRSSGLSVPNLHVYDYMDMREREYREDPEREHVLGQWQKQHWNLFTHIHVHDKIPSRNARLSVLAHEIAHEYHYRCHSFLEFEKREFSRVSMNVRNNAHLLRRMEDYTDRLAQFLLAKTCVLEPSVVRLGMYDIGLAPGTVKEASLQRSEKWAEVYRDLHCQEDAPMNTFDHALCAHERLPSVWAGAM
jgi:hypothetical protein